MIEVGGHILVHIFFLNKSMYVKCFTKRGYRCNEHRETIQQYSYTQNKVKNSAFIAVLHFTVTTFLHPHFKVLQIH